MQFEFATANRIVFGPGTARQAGKEAGRLGQKVLLASGVAGESQDVLMKDLEAAGLEVVLLHVDGEPTVKFVEREVAMVQRHGCNVVIGFGGGSALDTGKAIAAMLANPGELLDYLEVVGRGKNLPNASAPYIAIPTTAGTGAEVTRNAVMGVPEQKVKVSLRGAGMLPRLAIVDPELTYSLPPAVTASTGLDALTQVIEPYVSHKNNPLTDAVCREGIMRAARSLQRACERGDDAAARQDMAIASLCGGLALANAKLGAVHGFAAPFGGMFPAPHGATCARLLPYVMDMNVRSLADRQPEAQALARYAEVAQILTGNPKATALDGVAWIQELVAALNIPSLASYGLSEADFPTLVEKAAKASSMQGNPIQLTPQELTEILARAL